MAFLQCIALRVGAAMIRLLPALFIAALGLGMALTAPPVVADKLLDEDIAYSIEYVEAPEETYPLTVGSKDQLYLGERRSGDPRIRLSLRRGCAEPDMYRLITEANSKCRALAIGEPGTANDLQLRLVSPGTAPSQCWKVERGSTRYQHYTLQSGRAFPTPQYLGLVNGRGPLTAVAKLQLWGVYPASQDWTLTLLPDMPNVYKTEGRTDRMVHVTASGLTGGELRTAVLFVDFSDATATRSDFVSSALSRVLGDGRLAEFFKKRSFGRLVVSTPYVSGTWRRMPKPVTSYDFGKTTPHQAFIIDAVSLYPSLSFSAFDFLTIVVPPAASKLHFSSTRTENPGSGLTRGGVELARFVTLGSDVYEGGYKILAHEVGHVLGLPDLYDAGGNAENSPVGPWDIMSDSYRGQGYLGWHLHKLGWLPRPRIKEVFGYGTHDATLVSLQEACGTYMVVVPLEDREPKRFMVIERAGTYEDKKGAEHSGGVLIYAVDLTKATGNRPIVLYPKRADYDADKGNLFGAAWLTGDTFVHEISADRRLVVRILMEIGADQAIQLAITDPRKDELRR